MIYSFKLAIYLLITFGFGFLPEFPPITQTGMNVLGIFFGLVYAWIFIDILWPSLAGLVLLMSLGGMPLPTVFQRSFGDPVVQMVLFIFVFCAAIEYHGLSRFISQWFISRKFLQGRPWLFTYMFLFSIFLLGALTSASPATIIGWSILGGICEICGYKKGDFFPAIMIFAVVFSAQMGMALIPFKQAPLTVLGAFENMMPGFELSYGKYIILSFIAFFTLSIILFFLMRLILSRELVRLAKFDVKKLFDSEPCINKIQKYILFFLFALILLLILPGILPKSLPGLKTIASIGSPGVVIMLIVFMCVIRIEKKPLFDFRKMAQQGIIWNAVLLLASIQPLTWQMLQSQTGISQFLLENLEPFYSFSNPWFFASLLSLATLILAQIMNNAAAAITALPILLFYCQQTGSSPALPLILIILSIHLAFLTPAGSPAAALLSGNDWISKKMIWKVSPVAIIISWAIVAIVTLGLGSVIMQV